MDHVVYLDYKAQELTNLLNGTKSMIIRGAAGRKMPYGRVNAGDILYFIQNNGEGLIRAKATVTNVFNSPQLSREGSVALVQENQIRLLLNGQLQKRFSGKRYLVLISVESINKVTPFAIDRSAYGNMDDWLPVGNISNVKLTKAH